MNQIIRVYEHAMLVRDKLIEQLYETIRLQSDQIALLKKIRSRK